MSKRRNKHKKRDWYRCESPPEAAIVTPWYKKEPALTVAEKAAGLRFTPTAWAKILWFRDHGNTEISGFCVVDKEDALLVTEFVTVKQIDSVVSVSLDDSAVADYFDQQVDLGRQPDQFARIWLHTHPGFSPDPSPTDIDTFQTVFGRMDWAIMVIVAKDDKTYASIQFTVGPGVEVKIQTSVDWAVPFGGADHAEWEAEYDRNIIAQTYATTATVKVYGPLVKHVIDTDVNDGLERVGEWDGLPQYARMDAEEVAVGLLEGPEGWQQTAEYILGPYWQRELADMSPAEQREFIEDMSDVEDSIQNVEASAYNAY